MRQGKQSAINIRNMTHASLGGEDAVDACLFHTGAQHETVEAERIHIPKT